MDLTSQIDDLRQTLRLLFPSYSEIAELRVLPRDRKGGISGYYKTDDNGLLDMASHAAVADADDLGDVYFGLNPRNPSLLPLADHTLESVKGGSEKTVTRRQWLLVDADPARAVKGGMATDSEQAASKIVITKAVQFLQAKQWPLPVIVASSGNGYHALWQIDLENDDDLVARCLQALAAACDTEAASVDTRLGDSPRICRLYGCWNRKGISTEDRPHRRSKILCRNPAVVVSRPFMETVAVQSVIKPAAAVVSATLATAAESMVGPAAQWLDDQKPAVAGQNGSGRLFAVACGLVRDFGLPRELAETLMLEKYNPRCVPEWSEKEIGHKLDGAEKAAADEPERVGWRLKKKGSDDSPRLRDSDLLQGLLEKMSLWHDARNNAYASITDDGITENYAISSKHFARKLGAAFYRDTGRIAKKLAITDATDAAEGLAMFNGSEHEVCVRVGASGGHIYLDLGGKKWDAIEVDATGWKIVDHPPVKFLRPDGFLPLREPKKGGSIELLKQFIPMHGEKDFKLLVSFLVAALRPNGPYPILILTGLQGGGKSTITRALRALIDPNDVPLRVMSRTEQDFAIEGQVNAILAFDNLSSVPVWLSDALCRLSTGGGFTTRELYTNTDLSIMKFCKPVILNGITDLATRGDLVERSMLVELGGIAKRKDEATFWNEFHEATPLILGALLDGVAAAIANLPTTSLDELPRMADFARWAMAAAPAFGWSGEQFLEDYKASAADGNITALEQYAWIPYLQKFIKDRFRWKGSATELFNEVNRLAMTSDERRGKGWPGSAAYMSDTLFRLKKALHAAGIAFDRGRENGKGRARYLTLELIPEASTNATAGALEVCNSCKATIAIDLMVGHLCEETACPYRS